MFFHRLRIPLAAPAAILILANAAAADAPRRPNVVLIVADDLNDHVGCYRKSAKTPNIDRLAAAGVRFDRAYCQYALCNPSRTSFLTGLRPSSTGVVDNTTRPAARLPTGVVGLPEFFHANGYATGRFGKIAHNSFEDDFRWDEALSQPIYSAATQRRFEKLWKEGESKSHRQDLMFGVIARHQEDLSQLTGAAPVPLKEGEAPAWPLRQQLWYAATVHSHELPDDGRDEPDAVVARAAERFIERRRNEPFFAAVGLQRPHLPWAAPKKYFDLYPLQSIEPPVGSGSFDWSTPVVARSPLSLLGSNPRTEAETRSAIRAYYASVSFMDEQVGRILHVLKRTGADRNTIVVFLSDHGYHLGDHNGMWHKLTLYEESLRVPLVVSAPGRAKGAAAKGLVELVDLFPTLAELTGLTPPAHLQGESFAGLLAAPDAPGKAAAFSEVVRQGQGDVRGRSVRTGRFRYTEWGVNGGAELYDLEADPREEVNLVGRRRHAADVERLRLVLRSVAADRQMGIAAKTR